ncbi:serine/threonine-protein kinase [Jatrophihabitans sp. YIM 134969]
MRTVEPAVVPEVEGWDLTRLLGVGGSAQVWHAVPVGGGEPAAVKLLPLADGAAPGAALAEAAALRGLDHEHLIRLQDVVPVRFPGSGRHGLALVLDLAEAGSLADLLRRRGRLAPGEVVTTIAPVALALAHVHGQSFVHGDVTPANLLFSADGMPLLADLGVARVIGAYGEVRTTAAYADPLVANGGQPSTSSDVFMLAATAFHALTGAPPWPDPLPGVALARAARGDVRPLRRALADVPPALAHVLLDALRREPHLRPSAAAFALDLGRAARPVAVDFDAGRAVGVDGVELAVWTGTPLPTGERETFSVEDLEDHGSTAGVTSSPSRRRGRHLAPTGRRDRPASPRRRLLVAGAVSVVITAVVVGGGVVLGGRGDPSDARAAMPGPVGGGATPAAASPAGAAPATWGDVLAGLDRARVGAFAARDPSALSGVYADGGLLAADRATLATQVPNGCSLQGATTTYTDVQPDVASVPADHPAQVTLQVTATLAPSVRVCPGRADEPVEGLAATPLAVTLTAVGSGYRITAQSTR